MLTVKLSGLPKLRLAKDTVLDAGCGVGGTSIYIARTTRAKVTGITLSAKQVRLAEKYARDNHVSDLIEFQTADYTDTHFPDLSFSVIIGLESICYASPKSAFLNEAYRLLQPGGRLIIADGYLNRKPENQHELELVEAFKNGFALAEFMDYRDMSKEIASAGFKNLKVYDKTQAVIPTTHFLGNLARKFKLLIPLGKLLKIPLIRSISGNYDALVTAEEMVKIGLAGYYIHTAQK